MASIGLALTNVLLGIGSIGTGIGFGVAEQNKMDELNRKSKKLKEDVATASDLYDHVYYMVSVNLERVKKSLDKLPSDMLEKLQKEVAADMPESDTEKAIQTLAKVLGYAGSAAGLGAGLLQIVRYFRNRKAKGEEPSEPPEDPPFEEVPRDGVEPPPTIETETTFTKTPMMTRLINGLNIAGIIFGVAGLATTIGLGVWTLEKLNNALEDVKKKQKQITKFQNAMEKALDIIVKQAGLPDKTYDQLKKMADMWKKISEHFDSYQKEFYYAIEGYYNGKTLDEVKKLVKEKSDSTVKPFPDDGYPLAKVIADDIKVQIKNGKTDAEIVKYFATENPKVGYRFVFNEFFISMLR